MATTINPGAAKFLAEHSPASYYSPGMSEGQFVALLEKFPDSLLEYTAEGTVLIIPSKDPERSALGTEVGVSWGNWAKTRGGHVVGAGALFVFPNGAWGNPDAPWWDDSRWQAVKSPK